MAEAVDLYNKHGSFNKHLNVYYSSGVPTAQANFDGVITFGGSRNTRVAMHEMGHTLGVGTYWAWNHNLSGNVWIGGHGARMIQELEGAGAQLHGDSQHFWPYGLNYDSEDGFSNRIRHIRMLAALVSDMGFLSFYHEPASQVVPLGGTAVFHVDAAHAQSYAWYKQGDPNPLTDGGGISGATTDTLQIADVQAADEGSYYCVASGSLTSRPARLVIQQFVGHWTFDGNANDSQGSNHGTAYGSPAYVAGKTGLAIDLDGTNDYVALPAGVADARDMTVAAWVHWDGGGIWQRIFDFGTSTSQYLFLTPSSDSNTFHFSIKNGGSEQRVETSQLPVNRWVHVAVTLREDTATLYVDGTVAASGDGITIDPIDFSPGRNYIGESQWSADPFFNGQIDDFRIYNYALPGSEIWALWGGSTNQPPVFTGDPILLPDAAEGVSYFGQTLADYVADPDGDTLTYSKVGGPGWLSVAADGTLSGMPGAADAGDNVFVVRVTDPFGACDDTTIHIRVYSNRLIARYRFEDDAKDTFGTYHGTASGSPAYTTGVIGRAIDLDGSADFVTLPAGLIESDELTVAAWVRWDGGGQWQRIFDFGRDTNAYLFLTPRSGGNTLRFAISTTSYHVDQWVETSQLPIGRWVHVAVTLQGNTGTIYVDGVPVAAHVGMTLKPSDIQATVNYIGKSQYPSDPLFNGRIDDFRIYGYALSEAAIAKLARPQTDLDDLSDLAAWWLYLPPQCNGQDDCLATDLSGDGEITLSDLAEMAARWL